MFLSDKNIEEYLESGKIKVFPQVDLKNIRPAGLRVHLADKILIPEAGQVVDPLSPSALKYRELSLEAEPYRMKPGEFLLASILESIQMDRSLVAFIDGRSTVARLGLTVHLSSTTIGGNYDEPRATTLEMKNMGNFEVVLHYKFPVGMVVFAEMKDSVIQNPQTQYAGQSEVAPPNIKFQP